MTTQSYGRSLDAKKVQYYLKDRNSTMSRRHQGAVLYLA